LMSVKMSKIELGANAQWNVRREVAYVHEGIDEEGCYGFTDIRTSLPSFGSWVTYYSQCR
jgi:hypothetical protein